MQPISRRAFVAGASLTALSACMRGTTSELSPVGEGMAQRYNNFAYRFATQGLPPGFVAKTARAGDSWVGYQVSKMFSPVEVMRFNRQNTTLQAGQLVIMPPSNRTWMSLAPLPARSAIAERHVLISRAEMAIGAYEGGHLKFWGPATTGAAFCVDTQRACVTPHGQFRIFEKNGPDRRSTTYPLNCAKVVDGAVSYEDCAPMPYFCKFNGAIGFHEGVLVGGLGSHGCVNLFPGDAIAFHGFVSIGTLVVVV